MPGEFSKTDVEQVAILARLRLTDREKTLFAEQLARILRYADEVRELDTTGVAAAADLLDLRPFDRPDIVRPSLPREDALGNAPDASPATGLFKVPRVLGG
ncbi:MAG: Asp-tRNA(Asn)/Glu-tRNA(Gln) amidotransferase subunit GatC [Bacteroidales bacterium]